MQQWHIYYRTVGMQEDKVAGWRRSDYMADTAEGAMGKFMEKARNVLHARVYPGNAALTFTVEWEPRIEIRHRPHDEEE